MPENLLSLVETSRREELRTYIKQLMECVSAQAQQIARLTQQVAEQAAYIAKLEAEIRDLRTCSKSFN